MKDVTDKNFGTIIAFLLPGALLLWGLSLALPDVGDWFLLASAEKGPSVGGFLFSSLAALSLGLLLSAIRWLIIDHIHEWTGIAKPNLKFEKLTDQHTLSAFSGVVENHYRYYQYYANSLIAIIFATIVYFGTNGFPGWVISAIVAFVCIALFLGSRDALSKYYERAGKILS
jgi:chromate transport protein ChrA